MKNETSIRSKNMPTDPVCGMSVAENSPLHVEHGGETYHFCSDHCLHKFEADPTHYVAGAPETSHGHGEHASHHHRPLNSPSP